eukprot:Em0002g211a
MTPFLEPLARAVHVLCIVMACCHAQSIDTKEPIIRTSPDLTSTDYFGYSAVLHQTPVATVSFTKSTACFWSLRIARVQHLLDATEVPMQSSICSSLRSIVNLLATGSVSNVVSKFLAGGNLTALTKDKPGSPLDIRPIAVRETLRRLVGKCQCQITKGKASDYFSPHQFGVACPSGAEKIVHGLGSCIEEHQNEQDFVMMKIDLRNAFNLVSRQALLDECSAHFPELLQWAAWCYGQHPLLWSPMGTIMSESGVQQGDPLGPLLFCLVLQKVLSAIASDPNCFDLLFHAWYINDGVIAGPKQAVVQALSIIQDLGPPLGLVINSSKCELYGDCDLQPFPSEMKKCNVFNFEILGAPIGDTIFCAKFIAEKRADPLDHHALTCRHNGDVVSRHNRVRDVFFESCRQAGVGGQMEVGSGLGHDARRTRPADVLVPNWVLGKPAAFDITVTSPLTPITLHEASVTSGSTAQVAENRKHASNDAKCSKIGWVCVPLAVEAYGCWGPEAQTNLSRLAARLAIRSNCCKSQATLALYGSKMHFGVLDYIRADVPTCDNPWGSKLPYLRVGAVKSLQIRVLIGAPNGTAPGSAVNNTGLVYVCPVTNPGTCAGLTTFTRSSLPIDILLYDTSSTASRVTMASGTLKTTTSQSGTADFGYQGYTVASGRILQKTTEDFLVSVPRFNNMGVVNLVMNSATVAVVSQPLQGTQLSEYYGFSIITADLTGDGYDEVLVGAPYYSPVRNPEAGRVYVYRNNAGSLQFVKQLFGNSENYGRFGHAMTNLGDINGDGLDDVAISAPFASGGGKVFIYNGVVATTISSTHSQVIQGIALQTTINLVNLTSFGTSLSSGVDIDKNTYNDLAVGAYNSGQVFILRTRPTAKVAVSLTANPTLVQLTNGLYPSCNLNGTTYACFNLTACLTYTGNGVSNLLNLTVTIIGDASNQALGLASRLFIGTNSSISTFVTTVGTTKNIQSCLSLPVYIKNEILDKLNGFAMQMNVSVQDFAPPSQNGNGTLTNLTGYPVLSVQGTSSVQVTSIDRGNCSSGTCIPIPNLAIQFLNISYEVSNGTGQSLVAQHTTNLNLWFNISNSGQNAFAAVLTFLVPKSQLYFIRCDPNLAYLSTIQDYSPALFLCTCQVANPLPGGNYSVIAVRMEPTANIDVTQGVIPLTFNVSSQNPENQTTVQDNSVSVQMNITATSGLSVDPIGIARPEQIILSTTTNTTSASSLGPSILTTFTVRNAGPSTIPLVQLNIYWPLNSSETGNNYYLIPTSLQALTTTFFTQCDTTYLNLIASSVNATQAPSSSSGGNKRRAASLSTSTAQDSNKTIDCQLTPSSCVRMQCNISQLPQSQVQIAINAALDLRYYTAENIQLTFIPYVNVSIGGNGANYIVQTSLMKSATATIKVLKSTTTNSDTQTGRPAWVGWVIGGICVLLILIIVGLIVVVTVVFIKKRKAMKDKFGDELKWKTVQVTDNHTDSVRQLIPDN